MFLEMYLVKYIYFNYNDELSMHKSQTYYTDLVRNFEKKRNNTPFQNANEEEEKKRKIY